MRVNGYYWTKLYEESSWAVAEHDEGEFYYPEDYGSPYTADEIYKINKTRILNPDEV